MDDKNIKIMVRKQLRSRFPNPQPILGGGVLMVVRGYFDGGSSSVL